MNFTQQIFLLIALIFCMLSTAFAGKAKAAAKPAAPAKAAAKGKGKAKKEE